MLEVVLVMGVSPFTSCMDIGLTWQACFVLYRVNYYLFLRTHSHSMLIDRVLMSKSVSKRHGQKTITTHARQISDFSTATVVSSTHE